MIYIYNDNGEVIGKFQMKNAKVLANNQENNDTRWSELLRTAKGAYVIAHETQWQGEHSSYSLIPKSEAIELMERWGCSEGEIKKEFPDYAPVETI